MPQFSKKEYPSLCASYSSDVPKNTTRVFILKYLPDTVLTVSEMKILFTSNTIAK